MIKRRFTLPLPAMADGSTEQTARLKVEDAPVCFAEGRQFRISYPFTITEAPVVVKVSSPIDFILRTQTLAVNAGGVEFNAFRDTQVTESTPFTDEVPVFANNFQSTALDYTRQIDILNGGTITVGEGEVSVETIRVITSGATAQRTTVGGAVQGFRGLAAGDYYLVFSKIGEGNAAGVYTLLFEERP